MKYIVYGLEKFFLNGMTVSSIDNFQIEIDSVEMIKIDAIQINTKSGVEFQSSLSSPIFINKKNLKILSEPEIEKDFSYPLGKCVIEYHIDKFAYNINFSIFEKGFLYSASRKNMSHILISRFIKNDNDFINLEKLKSMFSSMRFYDNKVEFEKMFEDITFTANEIGENYGEKTSI